MWCKTECAGKACNTFSTTLSLLWNQRMALSEADKLQIISVLGVGGNFNRYYALANRNWFIRHMIKHYALTGVADANISSTIQTFTQQCKTIADSKQNFSIGVAFSAAILRSTISRRVAIIYGALAANPDLATSINANLLDFVVKRRFRAVMRMDYFVNLNSRGYFRYPNTCPLFAGDYKVVDDAARFWQAFDGGWNGEFFRLTPAPSIGPPVDPALSIERLFVSKRNACQGNLLDCARVLSIVFMDALFESVNKDTLLGYLATKTDTHMTVGSSTSHNSYISICHPNDAPNSQFITDTTPEGLFSKLDVLSADLQVGDHVYIYNHPLYKVFHPNGAWRGEHALVYDVGDRNYRSRNGFMFGGHGKEGTLYGFYSAFMQELKTHIERTYEIARVHLTFLQEGNYADGIHSLGGGGDVTVLTTTLTGGTTAGQVTLLEYHKSISYVDYQHGGRRRTVSRFVIGHPTRMGFWIDAHSTNTAVISAGTPTDPIPIGRKSAPSGGATDTEIYDPEFFAIIYATQNGANAFYDLFQRASARLRLRQININDLFAEPFATVPGTASLETTQPRVDVSATYQNYLRSQGAIA